MLDYKSDIATYVTGNNGYVLLISFFISFVVALVSIKFLVSLVNKFGFKYFGYYRVAIGVTFGLYLLWK